mgnify:CR=1 FL=1
MVSTHAIFQPARPRLAPAIARQPHAHRLAALEERIGLGGRGSLEGSFSAGSTATIATKYSFFQVFRDLQNYLAKFSKILQNLAEKDPRVLIHHVEELPPGWLGKVNAMQQGLGRSTGVWLLFTDADVHFQKESLERIIDVAERNSVDYLCVVPEVQARQRLLKALYTVSLSGFFLATRIWEVKNQKAFVGVGACGLVRRSLLEKSPGLPWLKMEVVDDLALAQLVWQAGGKLDVYWGRKCLGVEWYPSMGELIKGLEKNLFAGAQYQYWRALLGIIAVSYTHLTLPTNREV